MLIHLNGQDYDCVLLDDGTLDTVVRVNGDWIVRFDSACRSDDPDLDEQAIKDLFIEAIEDYEEQKELDAEGI